MHVTNRHGPLGSELATSYRWWLFYSTPIAVVNKSSKLHRRSVTPANIAAGNRYRPLIASRVRQHQLVYGALGDRMREEIHALSMKTFSPEEWAER